MAEGTKHILVSLAVNVTIAIAKAVAAVFTGSGSMLAEAIHSAADCTNQVLLLFGVSRAVKKPSPSHPLGIGLVLIAVAIFLGHEIASLLLGERADPHVEETIRAVAAKHPNVERVLTVLTVQQAAGARRGVGGAEAQASR